MSEIPIFVPSKGRPDSSTARLLAEAGLAFTVVVEPQDERRYSRWPTVAIERNGQGIAYVRSWIKANAASDWYWMLDDDITAFYETASGRNKRVDAARAIRGAEKFFVQDKSVAQAALEYQQFAWSSKKPVKLSSAQVMWMVLMVRYISYYWVG